MKIDADRLLRYDSGEVPVRYGERDCILYALSIGIGMDPCDAGQLRFGYERGLAAFPTMASVLGWPGRLTDPAYGIDHRTVVASDLDVQWLRPLAPMGELVSRARVGEVIDKGPGQAAIVRFERSLDDIDGRPVAIVRNSILARGQGGFGGSAATLPAPIPVPEAPADRICDLKTPPNLALLFRLHGDTNPIHVDPQLAAKAGFAAPLLHGAATFGIAGHALARSAVDGDIGSFARMQARFAKPFFPGETLRTEIWVRGPQVHFRCRSLERDAITLDFGLLELHPPR